MEIYLLVYLVVVYDIVFDSVYFVFFNDDLIFVWVYYLKNLFYIKMVVVDVCIICVVLQVIYVVCVYLIRNQVDYLFVFICFGNDFSNILWEMWVYFFEYLIDFCVF